MPRTKPPANIKKMTVEEKTMVPLVDDLMAPALRVPVKPVVVDPSADPDLAINQDGVSGDLSTTQLGVAGAKIYSGYVLEEFLPKLQGERGRKIYREMRDNDSTVGAILFAIEMLLRATPWTVEFDNDEMETAAPLKPNTESKVDDVNTPEGAVAFLESILDDMDDTWEDTIANVVTMLTFGWEYTEIVGKLRKGLKPAEPHNKSKYDDGYWGIRKLVNIAQETLDKWEITDTGEIIGIFQMPPNTGTVRYIPYWKSMLFRPTPNKDSPEGRSSLRNAYRSWYFLKNIQEIEAIGIERELNGFPVVYIPNSLLNSTDPKKKTSVQTYVDLVRDIKLNSQGGAVLPSDTFTDDQGKPSNVRKVELELLSAGGSRAIDTDKVIMRYEADIARTVLADFIMLGQGDRGSFALSKSKTDLFLGALEGWNNMIAAVFNRRMVPYIWEMNGFDMDVMPYLKPGRVAPEDLKELGEYIKALGGVGITLGADKDTENHLRDVAGLPEAPLEDEMDLEEGVGAGMERDELGNLVMGNEPDEEDVPLDPDEEILEPEDGDEA